MNKHFGVVLAWFLLLLCGVASAAQNTVYVGVLHVRGAAVAREAWTPMMGYLEQQLPDKKFELVPVDYAQLGPTAQNREVDFLFTAAGQYVELERMHGVTRIATVKNTGPNGDFSQYGGVLVVRADQADIQKPEDLKGKTLLIANELSFGGWQMQWREFKALKMQPGDDFKILSAGNNEQVFLDLLAGKGDAAAARSDVIERMARDGKLRLEDFRLIRFANAADDYPYWVSTPLYPDWPFSKLRHTPDTLAERVLVALLQLPADSPAAKAAEIVGFSVPRNYEPVSALYRDLELGPYAHQHIDWHDVFDHHALDIFIGALLLLLAGGVLALRLGAVNRRLARENRERRLADAALREEKARSESYLELMGSVFIVLDAEGKVVLANRRANEVLGYDEGELEGRDWFDVSLPDALRDKVRRSFIRIMSDEKQVAGFYQHEVKTRDGGVRTIRWSNRVVRDTAGIPVSMISAGNDITDQLESDAQLHLFAQVFEASAEGVVICDEGNRIISINRAFTEITGYELVDVKGQDPKVLTSGRQGKEFYRQMWAELDVTGSWQGEIWNRRKTGEIYPEWLSIRVLRNAQRELTHYVAVFTDISRHKQDEARIHFLAYYDPLTSLPNRALLTSRFEQSAALAHRHNQEVAILFVDLDRFKQINDSLGHKIGDLVLQGVAERFSACVRESDTVARLGGDEFILLLPDVNSPDNAQLVAEKCIEALRKPFVFEGNELLITPSIGIAIGPQDGDTLDVLVKNADAAMYAAKDAGRATWRFFTGDMNARIFARMLLENQLRRAIEREEFVVFYQPQLHIETGRPIGVEALVRWQHPEQGLVFPGDFIAVAEETGLIAEIGRLVTREACRQMAVWHADGMTGLTVAVNVAAPQFRTDDFFEMVTQALKDSGVPSSALELELTESILVEDVEETLKLLVEFKKLGVLLSVDDFGTGYSSLSYLKRFPVDRLKIDQSFVRGLDHDQADRAIVASVIAMGKHLKLHVLAEGVETEEHLAILRAEGCDEYQGYLCSKPLPAAGATDLLRKLLLGT